MNRDLVVAMLRRARRNGRTATRRGLVDVHEPSAEPFRTLRLTLDLRSNDERAKMIVFTSADAGEGKSTCAANYALVAAVNDRTVLLVDADLRKGTQHEVFGVSRAPGLTDAVALDSSFRKVARTVVASPGQLDLITCGTALSNPGDVTASGRLHGLLEQAAAHYDTVVIDTPPVLAAADAAHIAAHAGADVAFVVVRGTRGRRVSSALGKLDLVGANVTGFVLNREGRLSDYGYY